MYWLKPIIPLLVILNASAPEKRSNGVRNCGHHFLGSRFKYKAVGGRQLNQYEYPWVAAIKFTHKYSVYKRVGRTAYDITEYFTCSGVLISPKHVLLAAHCVLNYNRWKFNEAKHDLSKNNPYKGNCAEMKEDRVLDEPHDYSVLVGGKCIDPRRNCTSGWIQVDKLTITEDYKDCSSENDLALFELEREVSSEVATPICLPTRRTRISRNLKMAGSGMSELPFQETEKYNGTHVIDMSFIRLEDNMIRTTTRPGVAVCWGDSGAPVFQTDSEGVSTLVGIISSGDLCVHGLNTSALSGGQWTPCFNDKRNLTDFSTDVRVYLDWICQKSGICPEDNDTTTNLYEREHSADFCSETSTTTSSKPVLMNTSSPPTSSELVLTNNPSTPPKIIEKPTPWVNYCPFPTKNEFYLGPILIACSLWQ